VPGVLEHEDGTHLLSRNRGARRSQAFAPQREKNGAKASMRRTRRLSNYDPPRVPLRGVAWPKVLGYLALPAKAPELRRMYIYKE